ncbi:MAG: AEC family transporter, partial [Rhodocyclaceae bacterium]|nr:AEC family transporter [Rhodocyclaceae bacterium]
FSLSITGPVFAILVFGFVLRRRGLITLDFAKVGSDLVFRVTLPCLLFVKLVTVDFLHGLPVRLLLSGVIGVVAVFVVLEILAGTLVRRPADRGVFVQGSFRSNMGIIGLAYCFSAFGEEVVAVASIHLAVMTTLYNVLSVIALTRHLEHAAPTRAGALGAVLRGIARNPLIIAIAAGVLISISGLHVPKVVLDTGGYFARMTLPLALLCAGAS